jgi:hypothetical protein
VFIAINGAPIESLSSTAKVTNAAREREREREREKERERELCFKVCHCPFALKLIDSNTGLRNRKEKKYGFTCTLNMNT